VVKKIPLPAIILLLGLVFSSCKKSNGVVADNPYGLPNATQTGENTFACRINDSNWIFQDVGRNAIVTSYCQNNNRDSLWIYVHGSSNSTFHAIRFSILGAVSAGSEFRLSDTTQTFARADAVFLNCKSSDTYGDSESMYSIDGNIKFTRFTGTYTVPDCCTHGNHDPNAIIAGTFNFTVIFPGCSDTIRVTDGRFDINYSQY
jgi:hypothetical protein